MELIQKSESPDFYLLKSMRATHFGARYQPSREAISCFISVNMLLSMFFTSQPETSTCDVRVRAWQLSDEIDILTRHSV